jgi:peptide/nickel transport system substrate-binding protein
VTVDLATGKLAPMLATAWKQVDDTTWEFTLGDGVTFHDGSPFNAEAAAFAVNWVWNPQNSFHIRETMASQITAEAAGDNVIHVKTETADPLIRGACISAASPP